MRLRGIACAVGVAAMMFGCKAVDDLQNHLSGAQFATRLEKMDPSSGSFVQRAAPPESREPYVVVHGGAIYLIAGVDGSIKAVPQVEKYDPVGNTYTKLADWPNPTIPDNFVELGAKICGLGGALLDGTDSADLNCFDTDKNAWSKAAAIPSSAGSGTFRNVSYGGKLYAFEAGKASPVTADAGSDVGVDATWDGASVGTEPAGASSFYVYDPATDAWTQKADSPVVCNWTPARTGYGTSGIVGIGSVLYVLGCFESNTGGGGYGGPAFAYDTTKDTWTQIPTPPLNVIYSYAVGNKIVVVSQASPFVALYDVASSTWSTPKGTPPPMIPFDWTAVGDATGLWYFDWADGADQNSLVYYGEAWRYDPSADTWTKTATLTRDVDSSNRPSFFPVVVGSDLYIAGAWVSAVITLH